MILRGNLAPEGAVAKVKGITNFAQRGPAKVFECEEDIFAAIELIPRIPIDGYGLATEATIDKFSR